MMSLTPPSSAASGAKVHWGALSGLWHLVKELVSVWDVENTALLFLLLACSFAPPDTTEAEELPLF